MRSYKQDALSQRKRQACAVGVLLGALLAHEKLQLNNRAAQQDH